MFLSGVQSGTRLDSRLKHAGMTDFGKEISLTQLAAGNRPVEIENVIETGRVREISELKIKPLGVRLSTNGAGLEIIEIIPFMLSSSKHVPPFSTVC